LIASLVEQLIS